MDNTDGDEMWRYEIKVKGTGIQEYYEYSEKRPPDAVGNEWLRDAEEKWSGAIAEELADGLKVTPLWDLKNKQSSEDSEPIPLPPPAVEEE